MKSVAGESRIIRFGAFELDGQAGELRKQGLKIRLQEQPLRILQMLLESPGQLVSREELRAALWPSNSYVDFDQGLNRSINRLREALGDSADSPRFIETLARRGYRFVGNLDRTREESRSLLVLPLSNLSQDPEQAHFADGLTEALTTTLAKIKALRVLSRTTAEYYKRVQKPLPDVARELGVDVVVEGSVLRSQGRVRITVQLVHAPTDTHLWAETYDRDLRDILALQAELTEAIAREIRVTITPDEQVRLAHVAAVDAQAYESYLLGLSYWDKRSPDALRKAIQAFEQAIARAPDFAPAYAGLAQCFNVLGFYGYLAPQDSCGRAKVLALKALEIDSNLAPAHAALGWVAQYLDFDFPTAEREYQRSIALDPRYALAHFHYAIALACVGRSEEAIAQSKEAISVDPYSAAAGAALTYVYWLTRRFEPLLVYAKAVVELYPNAPQAHWGMAFGSLEAGNFETAIAELQLALHASGGAVLFAALLAETHALAGNTKVARELLAQLLNNSGQQYVMPYMVARVHAALGERETAVSWLEKAYSERDAWTLMLNCDPHLDSLRSDPRFAAIVRRMNIPA